MKKISKKEYEDLKNRIYECEKCNTKEGCLTLITLKNKYNNIDEKLKVIYEL